MAQTLFSIGGYAQRSYGVIVALAILLGAGVAYVDLYYAVLIGQI